MKLCEFAAMVRLAMVAAAALGTSGCVASTDETTESSADAVTQTSTVALPPCVPRKMPEGASIRMMFAPKYVFHIQDTALTREGISSDAKVTVSRRTRGAVVPLGTIDASSGELKFELPRGDVATTSYSLDFGVQTPLSPAAKKHLGDIYVVFVMKDGWLGDSIAARCEAGGT